MAISCRVAYLGFYFEGSGGGGVFKLNLESWEYLHGAKSLLVAFGGMLIPREKIKMEHLVRFGVYLFCNFVQK